MSDEELPTFEEQVRQRLEVEWLWVSMTPLTTPDLPPEVRDAIHRSINSRTKTYRYVLPTQLLAKLVAPDLDCRGVQAGAALPNTFDARSICHKVIVPFDRLNNGVLGDSAEPYLNNPLRIPAILPAARAAQKDKNGFDDLMAVLDFAQAEPAKMEELVRYTLTVVRDRLAEVSVTYPVPNRVSLGQTLTVLETFLAERTGGLRMQVVAVALFRTVADRFKLFRAVRSNNVNAADASTGSTADLECVDESDAVVMAVEVKDRQLQLRQVQDKLPGVRAKGVGELLFLVQGGVVPAEEADIKDTISRQFVTGQNVYVVEWAEFLSSCLVLFGEGGRRDFLKHVGDEMNLQKADILHRRRWAELLNTI